MNINILKLQKLREACKLQAVITNVYFQRLFW